MDVLANCLGVSAVSYTPNTTVKCTALRGGGFAHVSLAKAEEAILTLWIPVNFGPPQLTLSAPVLQVNDGPRATTGEPVWGTLSLLLPLCFWLVLTKSSRNTADKPFTLPA